MPRKGQKVTEATAKKVKHTDPKSLIMSPDFIDYLAEQMLHGAEYSKRQVAEGRAVGDVVGFTREAVENAMEVGTSSGDMGFVEKGLDIGQIPNQPVHFLQNVQDKEKWIEAAKKLMTADVGRSVAKPITKRELKAELEYFEDMGMDTSTIRSRMHGKKISQEQEMLQRELSFLREASRGSGGRRSNVGERKESREDIPAPRRGGIESAEDQRKTTVESHQAQYLSDGGEVDRATQDTLQRLQHEADEGH